MFTDFKSLVQFVIEGIFSPLTALLVALAVLYFFIGVITFIRSGDNESERSKGRNQIIFGLIGLAVMVSVWGLVSLFTTSFGLNDIIPQF